MVNSKNIAAGPARRLLALLAEDDAIETAPAAEVRAELAALGCDAAASTELARRLAAGQVSPARRLLDKLARLEAEERDLASFEQADRATIAAQLPSGSAAAIAARLRGRLDENVTVIDLRRSRRRRAYGWGGLAAAASIMLVVAMSWRLVDVGPVQVASEDPSSKFATASRAEHASSDVNVEPPPAVPSEPARPQRSRPAPDTAGVLPDAELAARLQETRPPRDATLTALLIVDPRLAPPAMRSRTYPEGNLALRLPQARKLAAGRAVVALVSLQDESGTQDLAVVARAPGEARAAEPPDSVRALFGDEDAFSVVPLPDSPARLSPHDAGED